MQFGHQFKSQFEFEEGSVCVNQSSYGQCPKKVSDLKRYWLNRFIGNPDKFVKYDYLPQAKKNKQAISEFLEANDEQTFFTQNATEAYNGVLKSLKLKQGDTIVYNNINFPMIKALLTHQQEYVGIDVIEIEFTMQDLKNDVIIAKYKEQFESNNNIKVAIFDFISSMPSVVFPVKQLIELCKEYNIISLIDGAHGAGIAEINLNQLDPDFFFTNLHKWCFTPCPVTLLYMNKRFVNKIHTSTISMYYGLGTEKEFEYNGTLDRTNFLCVSEGVSFVKEIGLQNIIKYSYELAWQGACLIAKIWGTQLMFNEEEKNMQSAMVMIEVPHNDWKQALLCQQKCSEEFNVFLVLGQFNGKIWSRVTASLYNELSDYEYAANSFIQTLKSIK